jgi:hypothetical protein
MLKLRRGSLKQHVMLLTGSLKYHAQPMNDDLYQVLYPSSCCSRSSTAFPSDPWKIRSSKPLHLPTGEENPETGILETKVFRVKGSSDCQPRFPQKGDLYFVNYLSTWRSRSSMAYPCDPWMIRRLKLLHCPPTGDDALQTPVKILEIVKITVSIDYRVHFWINDNHH